MIRSLNKILITVVMAGAFLSQAATITFEGFPASDFSSGNDAGFTITGLYTAVWGPGEGFPSQSIGAVDADLPVMIQFTNGGTFQFSSLDLVNPTYPGDPLGDVTVQGFLANTLVATDVFSVPAALGVPATDSAVNLSGQVIDSLVIQFTSGDTRTQLVDNVVLDAGTAAPEPGSFMLLSLGLAGSGLLVRRRRHS